jgi:hypothetical protein
MDASWLYWATFCADVASVSELTGITAQSWPPEFLRNEGARVNLVVRRLENSSAKHTRRYDPATVNDKSVFSGQRIFAHLKRVFRL